MQTDLEKVRKNGDDLRYINEQTEEVCSEAINENIGAFLFIKDENIKRKLINKFSENPDNILKLIKENSNLKCNNGRLHEEIDYMEQDSCQTCVLNGV